MLMNATAVSALATRGPPARLMDRCCSLSLGRRVTCFPAASWGRGDTPVPRCRHLVGMIIAVLEGTESRNKARLPVPNTEAETTALPYDPRKLSSIRAAVSDHLLEPDA